MIHFRHQPDKPSCPAGWEITRALSQPETSADVLRHMVRCAACTQLAAELGEVVAAAAELPSVAPMSEASRERISRALSSASIEAKPRSERRWRLRFAWALAGSLAAAGVAVYVHGQGTLQIGKQRDSAGTIDEGASLARVRAFGGTSFRRLSSPPDEIVHVESGRVAFEVVHLAAPQRFRVVTGDGEVEVRGTKFEVEAHDGRLWAVAVTEGNVDVRVGERLLRLQAGDEWQRQHSSTAREFSVAGQERPDRGDQGSATSEAPSEYDAHAHVTGSNVQPDKPKQADQVKRAKNKESFDLGWSYLRRGAWDEASRSFATVAAEARGQALEEDALYWQAVATARAGRSSDASQIFESFLQRFPTGTRAGAATLALAWLRFDAGDTDRARVLFERAALDSSARVREGAAEGRRRLHEREK